MSSLENYLNIHDLRRAAKRRAHRMVFDYIDGGADDEVTLGRNTNAFNDYDLPFKVLVGADDIDMSTTLLGEKIDVPFFASSSDALVALVDIAPTLLELVGVPVPREVQGKSLEPLMRGTETKWRDALFLENNMTIQNYPRIEGVRTQRWKYVRCFDRAKDQDYEDMLLASINGEQPVYEELFDLKNDPAEIQNLVSDPARGEILESLRARNAVLVKQFRGQDPLKTYIETTTYE